MISSETRADPAAIDPGAARPLVLLVDTDPSIGALLAEWLADAGVDAVNAAVAGDAAVDLVIADVPFPRRDGCRRLRAIADGRPGTPVLVLSPTIFAGVASRGAIARELGVAGVLSSPVGRETLVGAVSELLQPRR